MGLFDAITEKFSAAGESDIWNTITDASEVLSIIEQSKERPQLVYKHSNRCSVCFVAKGNLEQASEAMLEHADMHYLNVVKHREASDLIASELDIRHESPQVLLIGKGEVVWHGSHGQIESSEILNVIEP